MYYKGYIKKAGTGTEDIVARCLAYGLPKPHYQQDEDFRVVIYRPESQEISSVTQSGTQSGTQSRVAIQILDFCRVPRQVCEIREKLNYTNRTKFRQSHIAPLLEAELLEMTIPDKPTSSKQKYRTTEMGLQFLEQNNGGKV